VSAITQTYGGLGFAENAATHATRRFWQRRGLAVSLTEYRIFLAQIVDGLAPVIAKARSGGTLHRLTVRGQPVYVIYRAGAIVTVLQGVPDELRSNGVRA
jgi:hypothetical protein